MQFNPNLYTIKIIIKNTPKNIRQTQMAKALQTKILGNNMNGPIRLDQFW